FSRRCVVPSAVFSHFCVGTLPLPARPSLFPYTTLFRSHRRPRDRLFRGRGVGRGGGAGPAARHARGARGARGAAAPRQAGVVGRSEEHASELQSRENLVCRLLLEKKKKKYVMHVARYTC